MKLLVKIFLISIIIGTFGLQSCFKLETHPPEPQIKFIDFVYTDSFDLGNKVLKGELRFSFVDGDGDIGFNDEVSKTVFLNKFKIINNEAVELEYDSIYDYKIPYFSTTGDRKPIKGEIIIKGLDIPYAIMNDDTIMYKFYMVDRSKNKSNVESTGYLIPKDHIK